MAIIVLAVMAGGVVGAGIAYYFSQGKLVAVTAAAARIAGPLRIFVTTALVERLVRNVADYAVNAVAGSLLLIEVTLPARIGWKLGLSAPTIPAMTEPASIRAPSAL